MNDIYVPLYMWEARNFAGEWAEGTTYYKGQFVTRNGRLYHVTEGHIATTALMPNANPELLYVREFKGNYSVSVTYSKFDAVMYSGHGYYSLTDANLGNAPPTDGTSNTYWGCYVQRGLVGPQGDPGGEANHWKTQETPTGDMDGVNKSFTLSETPTGMVEVWWGSGLGLAYMLYGDDYTYSGTALTLISFAPDAANGDRLKVRYPYA